MNKSISRDEYNPRAGGCNRTERSCQQLFARHNCAVNCRYLWPVLLSLPLSILGIDPDRFGGPTELQDTFLPSQLRYQSYPESARVIPVDQWSVKAEIDWTAHLAKTDTYLFDGESVTSTLKVRHSPWENWELGIDLPYTARLHGTADEFIEFVETTLNARVPARFELPRDTYQATLITSANDVYTLQRGGGFNDLSLRAKRQLLESTNRFIDAAAVLTLALPTGENTFGGHGVSPGLGLHLQKPVANWLNFYLGTAGIYYSHHKEQNWSFHDLRGMAYGGAMWKPADWVGFLAIYQIYSPFAPGNEPLNEPAHYYSVTGRFWLNESTTFEAGIVENLGVIENRNSSDVTFKFALALHF